VLPDWTLSSTLFEFINRCKLAKMPVVYSVCNCQI
jgi:hypothetical protein